MELKLDNLAHMLTVADWFNRTFMELKCSTCRSSPDRSAGLIVPLWN